MKKKYKAVFSILTIIVIIAVVTSVSKTFFTDSGFGTLVSKRVKIAQGLEIPDWIDEEIIMVHSSARTGKHLSDIKNIVIHYVGNPNTSAMDNRNYFNKLTTTVSSHFIVGLEGEIIQCLPLWEKSAASNNRNFNTISIEVCHPDETGEFNVETYKALIKLCSWLCEEFDMKADDLIRHYDVTGKLCPKYYAENPDAWKKLKSNVKKQLD